MIYIKCKHKIDNTNMMAPKILRTQLKLFDSRDKSYMIKMSRDMARQIRDATRNKKLQNGRIILDFHRKKSWCQDFSPEKIDGHTSHTILGRY